MRLLRPASALPYAFVILLVGIIYWKAVFLDHLFLTQDLGHSDMMMHSFPARVELGQALRDGRLPLWTDNVFLGFPLAAEGQAGVFYPPNALSGLLPAARAYTLTTILHVVLAGLFTVLYARRLGRSRASAALAGTVMVLSAYMVTHLKHVNLIASTAWIPLGFWLVERWSERIDEWRPGLWLGLLLALGILAGHVQTAYYGLLVISVYLLAVTTSAGIQRRSWSPLRRGATVWGIMVAAGIGLSAVQILPTYEYMEIGTRSTGLTYAEATQFEYNVRDLQMYVDPYCYGDPGRATYHAEGGIYSVFWENCAYVGLVPLCLALVGAIFCRRQRRVWFLVGLTGFSILLALGRGSPLYAPLFHVIPGFDRFRFPQRFLLYATMSVAVLSAYGLDWLAHRVSRRNWAPPMVKTLAVILTVSDLFAFGYRHNPTEPADLWLDKPESVRFLEADPTQYRIWSPNATALHLLAYGRAEGWKGDLTPYADHRNVLQPNFNAVFGVPSLGAYFPVIPRRFSDEAVGLTLKPPMLGRILSVYNVKYVLVGGEIHDPQMILRASTPGNVSIYENLEVLPRARVVPWAVGVPSPEHALAEITGSHFDPVKTVALQGWSGKRDETFSEGSRVNEVYRREGLVELEVFMKDRGFLVLADAFYPGWEVRVNGEKGDILQANGVCRAVELPRGEHRVVFRYRPKSFLLGLVVTMIFLAIVGGMLAARPWSKSGGRLRKSTP